MFQKILKTLIISLCFINFVYADDNNTLVRNKYDDIYAVYDGADRVHLYYAERYTLNGITAYCIEPGLPLDDNPYTGTDDWSITNLSADVRNYIRLVAYYGYDFPGHNSMKYYLATQELIWRKIDGREIYWIIGEDKNGPRVSVANEKKEILDMVNDHTKKPSFDNKAIDVSLGNTTVISDENGVLSNYEIYSSDIDNASIDGNSLKITINNYKKDAQIKLIKKHYTSNIALIYYNGNNQKMMRAGILDPVVSTAKVNITIKAKVKVNKKDQIYLRNIKRSGIQFKIKNIDTNEYICETEDCLFKTNDDGYFITGVMDMGNYQLEEIENQNLWGYYWNNKPLRFTIDENSDLIYQDNEFVLELSFYNLPVRGQFTIYKKGEKAVIRDGQITYEEIPLSGVKYTLYVADDVYSPDGYLIYKKDRVIGTYSVIQGAFGVQNLALGKYCIKEIDTLENYVLDSEPFCFSFEYQDKYTEVVKKEFTFKNKLAKGDFELLKKDDSDNLLANATIQIYTENDELIYEKITDEDGHFIITDLPLGKYYYQEVIAPLGYVIDNQKHYFEIEENEQVVTSEFVNKPITGTFEFTKIDYDTGRPLANAEIFVYDENDTLLYTKSTDENGLITIENMTYGRYYFIESKAPDSYIIDKTKYYFEIREHNSIIKAQMTNTRVNVPNTYLNENIIIYMISIALVVLAIFLAFMKKKIFKICGIVIMCFAVTLPVYMQEKIKIYSKTAHLKVLNYITNTSKETDAKKKITQSGYQYIAVLEIPEIDLKQGLVNKYSKYNDVKYNVQIIDGSAMPDRQNSNLILASHNGNSSVSYFKDLQKLKKDSIVNVYYNGIKYVYKINNYYEVLKTGYVNIEREQTANAITLITCKDSDYQIVYIGYLINTATY